MGRRNQRRKANVINNLTYIDILDQLKELSINVFKYRNIPTTIDPRFLEITLMERGAIAVFRDPIIGLLALPFTTIGQLDVYNNPIKIMVYANNGYKRYLKNSFEDKQFVIIYNNSLRTPSLGTLEMFSMRLYEMKRTTDVNIRAQKTPVMVGASETQRLTMSNVANEYDGNEPFIFTDKDLEIDQIKVFNTQAPFIVDKMQIAYNQEWNTALTYLGIENSNQDKKERMVSDEVGSNYGNVEAQRNVRLNPRRQAVELINLIFGENIEIAYNSDLTTMVNRPNLDTELLEVIQDE